MVCSSVPAIFDESSMSFELFETRWNCCSMSSSSSGLRLADSISSTWNLSRSSSCSLALSEFLRSSRRIDFSFHSLHVCLYVLSWFSDSENASSMLSWRSMESSDWWSCGPCRSTISEPIFFRTERVAGLLLMNCLLLEWPMTLLMMSWLSSQLSSPESSRMLLTMELSLRVNMASTVHVFSPVRMRPLSARSPRMSLRAPTMTLFPAPVSPVTPTRPFPICHVSWSTRAKFLIFSKLSMVFLVVLFCEQMNTYQSLLYLATE